MIQTIFQDIDISKVLVEAIISIITILLGRYIIPWIKSKLISSWASEAVKAAEQVHGSGAGVIKKEEVLAFLAALLNKYHIKVSAEELDVYIESAVKKLKLEMTA